MKLSCICSLLRARLLITTTVFLATSLFAVYLQFVLTVFSLFLAHQRLHVCFCAVRAKGRKMGYGDVAYLEAVDGR